MTAAKDFGSIETDYEFFMSHATEAESDIAEHVRNLAGFAAGRETIRVLDFGCGTGEFSRRLASALQWPPDALRWGLVEPVQHQREEAARRLAPFSRHPIESRDSLPAAPEPLFDLVLSNHVLYYVDDLAGTLARMQASLRPGGKLLLAIAGEDNPLIQLWRIGFGWLGRPVPYHVAEEVEAILSEQGARFQKSRADYRLGFPDTAENRLKLLRFLFGPFLAEISPDRLLSQLDQYRRGSLVEVNTHSDHFDVESLPGAAPIAGSR